MRIHRLKLHRWPVLLLILLSGLYGRTYAQTLTVTGRVTGDGGEELPGVNIVLKGTSTGTTSNTSGNYSITVPDPNGVLVFSFIGFNTEEVPINGRSTINISLVSDIQSLSEVVVIGYGERERRDVTGAISQINTEDIQKTVNIQPELAMQGRMTGVFVGTPGGAPNARPQVRIRGVNTFGFAEPLYVIDGVPVDEFGNGITSGATGDLRGNINILNLINPNDIESISVLKDASAAAIYGVRAANGVVLITTRRGREGRPRVEVDAYRGVQNVVRTWDMLNTEQYSALYREAFANNPDQVNNLPPVFNPNNPAYLGNSPTYYWPGELLNRNAVLEDYSLKVSGATDAINYYVSAGYSRTESPLINNQLERYSLATNVNAKISKVFQTGLTYRLGYVDALDNTSGNLNSTAGTPPWQPIYDANNPFGYAPSISVNFVPNPDYNPNDINLPPRFNFDGNPVLLYGPETRSNVFGQMSLSDRSYALIRNLGTAFFQVEPIQGLRVRGTLSGDYSFQNRITFSAFDSYIFSQTPGNPYARNDGFSRGSYGERQTRNMNLTKELGIYYDRKFGDHGINILLNAQDVEQTVSFTDIGSAQVQFDDPRLRTVPNQPEFVTGFTGRDIVSGLIGYMARGEYQFRNKYYAVATIRRDGSYRFAPGRKWGTFPSFALGWRISDEAFMEGIPVLNDLKIRGGWGELGNEKTGAFAFISSIGLTPNYSFGSGNGDALGNGLIATRLPNFPNRDLTWERVRNTNIGFDAMLLNNRVNITFDWYRKVTDGILQVSNLPASVGNEIAPTINIASVLNTGIELAAGYNAKIGDLNLNVSGNITTVRNEVLSLFQDAPFGDQGGRMEVGQPLFFLWGYQVGGLFRSQQEIDAWRETFSDETNSNNFSPGDLWFRDINGNPAQGQLRNPVPDSLINANDRTNIGNTIPRFFYGASLGANWRNFDISILFQGVGGVQRYNGARAGFEAMSSLGANQSVTTLNRWTPENPGATMPRAVRADPAGNNRYSDRFVENAGFMRLRNFQLGYSLPPALLARMGFVERFRIYLGGSNLFTLTPWTGLDPEEVGGIPPTRSFLLGVNATF